MSNPISTEDQRRLEMTLSLRERIIQESLKDGKLPVDQEDRDFMMKALEGMDRTILTRAKIKSDDAAATNQNKIREMITQVLLRSGQATSRPRQGPAVFEEDTPVQLVEGETEIGVRTFSYGDLMRPQESKP